MLWDHRRAGGTVRGECGDGTGGPPERWSGREDNSDDSDFSDDSDKGGKEAGRNCRRTGGTVERQGKVRGKPSTPRLEQ